MSYAAPLLDATSPLAPQDEKTEFRHVIVPKQLSDIMPRHLLAEHEWRSLGLQQSKGWVHYGFYDPEPNILLFRRGIEPTDSAERAGPGGPAPDPVHPVDEGVNYFDDEAPPPADYEPAAPEAPALDSRYRMDAEQDAGI